MSEQKMRPPYVRFEKRAVEDRSIVIKTGVYGFKDVNMAKITIPGQKDTVERFADDWLVDVQKRAEAGQIPPEWPDLFTRAYEFWKKGQEMPLNGTPIKGWQVMTPAQQENLVAVGVLTVEDLSELSDEATQRIGTGAVSMKLKARAWLKEAGSVGSVAAENETLRRDLDSANALAASQAAMLANMAERLHALEDARTPAKSF